MVRRSQFLNSLQAHAVFLGAPTLYICRLSTLNLGVNGVLCINKEDVNLDKKEGGSCTL